MDMRLWLVASTALLLLADPVGSHAQNPAPERFTATAIVNNNVSTGAGIVLMDVTRWSSEREREMLVSTLLEKGPDALLEDLRKTKPVGTIRTPDSLAYDLHYSHQAATEDGGRRIVLATDRPIGFWEQANQPRTLAYPFTIVQFEMGPDGTKGRGTMSYATKVQVRRGNIELENFSTQPVMLTEVTREERR